MEEKILKHEEETKPFGEHDEERVVAKDFQLEIDKLVREGKLPPVSIHIFYSAHKTTQDMRRFEPYLAEADIYIPEALGCDEEASERYRAVSEGEEKPEEFLKKLNINPRSAQYAPYLHRLEA